MVLGTICVPGTSTPRAVVSVDLQLNETLARNGYFFGQLDTDSPFLPTTEPDQPYQPSQVLYMLTCVGRVDLADGTAPTNRARDRTVSQVTSVLTFTLPVQSESPGEGLSTVALRSFRDQLLEVRSF